MNLKQKHILFGILKRDGIKEQHICLTQEEHEGITHQVLLQVAYYRQWLLSTRPTATNNNGAIDLRDGK